MRTVAPIFLLFVSQFFSSQLSAQTANPRFSTSDGFFFVGDSFINDPVDEWAGRVDATGEFGTIDITASGGWDLSQIQSGFNSNYVANTYSAIVVAGGINDIADDSRTLADMQASTTAIINGTQSGEHVILATVTPFRTTENRPVGSNNADLWNQGRQDLADSYDNWVFSLADASNDISVFDLRTVLDPDGDSRVDLSLVRGGTDFLHPNSAGSAVLAEAFVNQFSVSAVPEPTAGGLLALLGAGAFLRRRRSSVLSRQ